MMKMTRFTSKGRRSAETSGRSVFWTATAGQEYQKPTFEPRPQNPWNKQCAFHKSLRFEEPPRSLRYSRRARGGNWQTERARAAAVLARDLPRQNTPLSSARGGDGDDPGKFPFLGGGEMFALRRWVLKDHPNLGESQSAHRPPHHR